jgi:anthranilate synthase component 2
MHGKQSLIDIDHSDPIFKGLPDTIPAARYHSLIAKKDSLPDCLTVIGTDSIGEVMAVKHKDYPVYGLQFHPESILTPDGMTILKNFLTII